MLTTLTLLVALHTRPSTNWIRCGWSDELNDVSTWQVLSVDNKPEVFAEHPGQLEMRLPHVPAGWPYQYQWSGVTRDAMVDLTKYPIMVARLTRVPAGSYAHTEIEELDVNGKQSWGIRGTTLYAPRLSTADVGKDHPGVRRVRMRLIIGGSNNGALVAYTYVRFIARRDLHFLEAHPDWQAIKIVR